MNQVSAPKGSLRIRMLLSASLVLVIFLGVMGLVLDNAYRLSAQQSVSERLLLQIYALIAASVEDDAQDATSLYLPQQLQEPHFNSLGSGLFGLVFNEAGGEIWRSQSALGLTLSETEKQTLLAKTVPGVTTFDQLLIAQENEPLFYFTYPVIWQTAGGEARYTYVILRDFGPYQNEVAIFRNSLWGWLVAGVIVLVGLQAAIMYWGLRPIAELEQDLKAIEEGRQDYLEGHYPKEIDGVTRNLNLLLSGEREQRERYRTTLADLAHSLKTPLAILKAEVGRPDLTVADMTASMDEQVSRMNDIISYQLERAVASSSSLVKSQVEVQPAVRKLINAIKKVYVDKGISIVDRIEEVMFPGDERDLLELLGNLIDNACKYGRHKVKLFAGLDQDRLLFMIEDDGPGINEADRVRVLDRGTRLDSRHTGQGIGLAVVAEIVARHGGQIRLEASELGGTKVLVTF